MFELFKAEFNRYRKWAFLGLIIQLCIWGFVSRLKPLLSSDASQNSLTILDCVIIGLIFGITQMILNTRKNNWTYLIQRPLPMKKIYMALSGAAIANIIIAIPLGWLLTMAALDMFTATVVDFRHYVFAFYMGGISITAYLIGSLIVLSASKGAIGLLYFIVIWLFPKPESQMIFFTLMTAIGIMLWYLNLKCFKPDLKTHVQKPTFVVMMAIPMSITVMFLLYMGSSVYYHIPRLLMGTHPDNNPVENSISYFWNMDDAKVVGHILKDHTDLKNKDQISRQAELADADRIGSGFWTYPSKGQMHSKDTNYGLFDRDSKTHWVFSHDAMMLHGLDSTTQKSKGWIGKNGFVEEGKATADDKFDHVPFMIEDQFLATKSTIYQINYEDKEIIVKYEAPTGSEFATPPQIRDHYVALLTDKNSYLFDKETFITEMEAATADYRIPHPIALNKIWAIETRRMVDGYLMLYFSDHYDGYMKPAVSMSYARLGRGVEQIAKTQYPALRHPALILDLEYTLSPGAYMLYRSIYRMLEPSELENVSFAEVLTRDYAPSVKWTALLLQIFSILCLVLLARKIKLGKPLTVIWTAMGAIFSLPAILCFLLMNKVRAS